MGQALFRRGGGNGGEVAVSASVFGETAVTRPVVGRVGVGVRRNRTLLANSPPSAEMGLPHFRCDSLQAPPPEGIGSKKLPSVTSHRTVSPFAPMASRASAATCSRSYKHTAHRRMRLQHGGQQIAGAPPTSTRVPISAKLSQQPPPAARRRGSRSSLRSAGWCARYSKIGCPCAFSKEAPPLDGVEQLPKRRPHRPTCHHWTVERA